MLPRLARALRLALWCAALVAPLMLTLAAAAWTADRQIRTLANQELAAFDEHQRGTRRDELRRFVTMARRMVLEVQQLPVALSEAKRQKLALDLLHEMDGGDDYYLFVYDTAHYCLMHPRLPQLVGKSQANLLDAAGSPIIRKLVARAINGGGFVEYMWNRPSTRRDEGKLGYVELDQKWNWVIGTGLYLDQLDDPGRIIIDPSRAALGNLRMRLLLAGGAGLALAALCGLFLLRRNEGAQAG